MHIAAEAMHTRGQRGRYGTSARSPCTHYGSVAVPRPALADRLLVPAPSRSWPGSGERAARHMMWCDRAGGTRRVTGDGVRGPPDSCTPPRLVVYCTSAGVSFLQHVEAWGPGQRSKFKADQFSEGQCEAPARAQRRGVRCAHVRHAHADGKHAAAQRCERRVPRARYLLHRLRILRRISEQGASAHRYM